ncbi:hypothetical protein B0H21DRAFT_796654 [Amylocystis lapponica]|nr:hypothetical protein B0H21DRAFT_796654 [Amylocystis lapponica]
MSEAMRQLRSQAQTSSSVEMTVEPPSTPPRGRAASRYPASLTIDPGRVPLHRRGTSKTYERLEDLLREAGYKETRIFTPEAERTEARAEERKGSTGRGVGAAVAGFLSGWMSTASRAGETSRASPDLRESSIPEPLPMDTARWSLPPSPLAHKSMPPGSARPRSTQSPSPSASSTTIASMNSYASSSSNGRTVNYRPRPSHGTLRPQSSAASNLRTYAQVSAARGYLRHMASAPNMPKRLSSTRTSSVERLSALVITPELPALPVRWLETVTKAVLGSGDAGAHVGGPASRQGLVDKTNKPRGAGRSASGVPPGLSAYLRVENATSAVSTARVMCRSAPGSRSSSRVGERGARGSFRGERARLVKGKGSGSGTDGVPMLASTVVENDAWTVQWVDGRRIIVGTGSAEELEDPDADDDDDDLELDLARLLVPPKRQYSIQSLRRHLHDNHRETGGQVGPWEDGGDGAPQSRGRSRRGSTDEADHLLQWEAMGVPGLDKGRRRRRGIPGGWGNG